MTNEKLEHAWEEYWLKCLRNIGVVKNKLTWCMEALSDICVAGNAKSNG